MEGDDFLKSLSGAVANLDENGVIDYTRRALEVGVDPLVVIEKGLLRGLGEIGERFGRGEAFVIDLIFASELVKRAMKILEPVMVGKGKVRKPLARVLIGTVKGDLHELGKNLVATMLTVEGFEVFDLGVDVSVEVFVDKVRELRPDILGLSALMTTTMLEQRVVIEALRRAGLRDGVKIMVGGAPISEAWARKVGADCYAGSAVEAVKKAKELVAIGCGGG